MEMTQEERNILKKMNLEIAKDKYGPNYQFPVRTEEERKRSMAIINTITMMTDGPDSEWTAEDIIKRMS